VSLEEKIKEAHERERSLDRGNARENRKKLHEPIRDKPQPTISAVPRKSKRKDKSVLYLTGWEKGDRKPAGG